MRFFTKSDNIIESAISYLRHMKLPYNKATIMEFMTFHQDYPSLLSLSDLFNYLGVKNVGLKVDPDDLNKIPRPWIAYSSSLGGSFKVVQNVSQSEVVITENGKMTLIATNEFLRSWDGTALLLDSTESSGEPNYHQNRIRIIRSKLLQWLPLYPLLGFLIYEIVQQLLVSEVHVLYNIYFILSILGLIVTASIIGIEIGVESNFARRICGLNSTGSCESVLKSSSSRIYKDFSWGDLGFIYFLASCLILVFGIQAGSIDPILVFTPVMIAPLVPLSLIYQKYIIKDWCPFCLIVAGIVFMETLIALWLFFVGYFEFSVSEPSILILIVSATIWIWLKPNFISAHKVKGLEQQIQFYKSDHSVLKAVLSKQRPFISAPALGLGLEFGPANAEHYLLKICNPFCNPCAEAHEILDSIMRENLSNVRIQIIFISMMNERGTRIDVINYFLAIRDFYTTVDLMEASQMWYQAPIKRVQNLKDKFPVVEVPDHSDEIRAMRDWCIGNDIVSTPTIYFNGYMLPKSMDLQDIHFFLRSKDRIPGLGADII